MLCVQVLVNDHVTKAVTLVNAGSLIYEYGWRLGINPHLAIMPQAGSVGPGDRTVCELTFSPKSSHQRLDRYKVTCHVVNGKTYTLLLSGQLLPLLTHILLCIGGHQHTLHVAAYIVHMQCNIIWLSLPYMCVHHCHRM